MAKLAGRLFSETIQSTPYGCFSGIRSQALSGFVPAYTWLPGDEVQNSLICEGYETINGDVKRLKY